MSLISANKTFRETVLTLTAIFFLWTVTFGLFHHVGEMKPDGTMSGCLFSEQMEVCTMNFSEHIALWQSMVRSLPQFAQLLDLLLVVSIALVALRQGSLFVLSRRITSRLRLYIKAHPHIRLFNFFREMFSRGILNSKIYSLV